MKKIRQCRICGKKTNSFYCCKEHMELWYRNNPRHLKVCECCGKEFKTNDKTQKYCSRKCTGKSIASVVSEKVKATALKKHTQTFVETFNYKVGERFEYISGYDGCDSIIKLRCKICGTVFNHCAQFLRKDKVLNCPHCLKAEKTKQRESELKERKLKQEEKIKQNIKHRMEMRVLKEQQRKVSIKARTKKCIYCGNVFVGATVNSVCCSDVCRRKRNNRLREIKKRERLRDNGKIDYSLSLAKLIKRDNNKCHICNGKCDINDYVIDNNGYFIAGDMYPSIDHVFPVSKGGTHTWDNVLLAHRKCNSFKNNDLCYGEEGKQMSLAL